MTRSLFVVPAGCVLMVLIAAFGLAATKTSLPAAPTTPTTTASTTAPADVLEPVPLLTPEEEIDTFNLPPGFRAEVVAHEPMVEHPVFLTFDERGRMWVAEMRSYMPDTSGWRENAPTGRVSVLEDTDGDGRMDKSTVFRDKLVLPRAIGFCADGVLIGTPPNLLLCRDLDGDLVSDEESVIDDEFAVVENPENFANGLMWGMDNWIYNADHNKRFRVVDGKMVTQPVPVMGQWGITRDDAGRMFFNTNSDHLRGSMIPPHYSSRNPLNPISLADTRIATDQTVWPAHAATMNRGYRDGFLRPDGTLKEFTAACSPMVYRGDLFPDLYGNVFVCEAAANLVRRAVVTEKDGALSVANAYDSREFIASTYERFRPVNLQTGPDGAIYLVDMHHGLIQHKMSLTEYAKEQYKEKELDEHLKTGRIFRIVPEGGAPRVKVDLGSASTKQLVEYLTHPNGWWRDTAQRVLVIRRDTAAIDPLRELYRTAADAKHRLNALWTLEAIGIESEDIVAALADKDPHVRGSAIRLAEAKWSGSQGPELFAAALKMRSVPDARVRMQLLLSAGDISVPDELQAFELFQDLATNTSLRQAVVSGLSGRELKFLEFVTGDPEWSTAGAQRSALITDVSRSLTRRHADADIVAFTRLIASLPTERDWQQVAMLDAIPSARRDPFGTIKLIELDERPRALDTLAASQNSKVRGAVAKIDALFMWPGKPVPPPPKIEPLTGRDRELFEIGKQQFALVCAQCHQPTGLGQEGKAPPLVNSPWVLGSDKRLIRIVLHGMRGPIDIGDVKFDLDMPALGAMTDEQIAGSLTYIRRAWGHSAPPVKEADVASIRDWTQSRRDGWTQEELLQMR